VRVVGTTLVREGSHPLGKKNTMIPDCYPPPAYLQALTLDQSL
jgi:hypothetical protein